MKNKLLRLWYKLIRRWVLAYDGFKSVDPREDFACGWCGKPVLRRVLYCSKACWSHHSTMQCLWDVYGDDMSKMKTKEDAIKLLEDLRDTYEHETIEEAAQDVIKNHRQWSWSTNDRIFLAYCEEIVDAKSTQQKD